MFDRLIRLIIAAGLSLVLSVPAWPQAALLPNAKQTFIDQNGKPLTGGKVYNYVPSTTVFKTTWGDAGETTPNTNPVTLDSAGRAVIYGQGSYQQRVTDAAGNLIWNAPTTAWNSAAPSGASGTDTAPVGTIMPYSGFVVPTNWALAYGQALLRTTYPELLAALTITDTTVSCTSTSPSLSGWADTSLMRVGAPVESSCIPTGSVIVSITNSTTIVVSHNAVATVVVPATVFPWGNGDGVTTFNVPDLRGRVTAGADAMGGTAANRLQATTTISTVSAALTATVASVTGVVVGMDVVSANVPVGTTVTALSGTTITLSSPASATVAGTAVAFLAFSGVNVPGSAGGKLAYTLLQSQIPSYSLTVTDPGHQHTEQSGTNSGTTRSKMVSGANTYGDADTDSYTALTVTNLGVSSAGGGQAFAILQPMLTVSYIIKVKPNTTGAGGVVSIGGMFGDILCGSNMVCAGQTISFSGPGAVVGPVSSVTNDLVSFLDASGQVLADSGIALSKVAALNTNLSATGGVHQVLQQSSAGATVTVGQLAQADIIGLTTADSPIFAGLGIAGSISITPTLFSINPGIHITQYLAGTRTPVSANTLDIELDQVDADAGFVQGLTVVHGFGGGVAKGGRTALDITLSLNAATVAGNTNRNYTAATFVSQAQASDGGNPSYQGDMFGLNPVGRLLTGATFMGSVGAMEANVAIQAGASAFDKYGIKIVQTADDAVSATHNNTAFYLVNQAGAVGWDLLFQIGDDDDQAPLKATGSVMAFKGAPTVAHGIDLSGGTCSTDCFKSKGFAVSPAGALTATALVLSGPLTFSPTTIDIGTNATTHAPRTVYANTSFVGPTHTATTAFLNTSAIPTLSTCGTGSPVASTGSSNQGGQFTIGGGTITTCTVTFAVAYPNYAFCTIHPANAGAAAVTVLPYISASSKTAFTVTMAASTPGAVFNYSCQGQ